MEHDEVVHKLRRAYLKLLRNDRNLLELDVNERSLTHKLAEYLQEEFVSWHVDCEYNRDGHDPKRVRVSHGISAADTDAQTVYPDVIVHRRGTRDNLVVVEAKKTSTALTSEDASKLRAYRSELGYLFAFEVVFPVNEAARDANVSVDVRELSD